LKFSGVKVEATMRVWRMGLCKPRCWGKASKPRAIFCITPNDEFDVIETLRIFPVGYLSWFYGRRGSGEKKGEVASTCLVLDDGEAVRLKVSVLERHLAAPHSNTSFNLHQPQATQSISIKELEILRCYVSSAYAHFDVTTSVGPSVAEA
jgi:hypothetical protein